MSQVATLFKAIVGVMRISFLNQLAYIPRLSIWALNTVLWVMMYTLIWADVLASSSSAAWQPAYMPNATAAQTAIVYFVLIYAVTLIVTSFNGWGISSDIKDGYLSSYLAKPMKYMTFSQSVSVAERWVRWVLQFPIILIVVVATWSFWPRGYDITTMIAIVLSVVLAALMWLQASSMLGLVAFWLDDARVAMALFWAALELFGGGVGPLSVFPERFQELAAFLPFRYMQGFIVELSMGYVVGSAVWVGLLVGVCWLIVLRIMRGWMWRAGSKRYSAVGG